MSDEQARVLERVRKMLRLANDAAASEGERENALRMAHATLAKYNLTLADAKDRPAEEEKRGMGTMIGKDYPWMRTVAQGVAELFFCKYLYVSIRGTGRVKHYFVGKESNTIVAREMSEFVISSIDREARMYAAMRGATGTMWRSFCKGASHRIYARCVAIRKAAETPEPAASSTSTALVLRSLYHSEEVANDALIKQTFPRVKEDKSKERNTIWSAAEAGAAFADKVPLNTQVGSTPERTKLK